MQLAGDAGRLDDCTIVAVTDLGGDFGFSGTVNSPESGFLTGLMKALLIEVAIMRGHKTFLSKAIDAPRSERPEELAANICRELAHGKNDYELAFVNGQRYLQVAIPAGANRKRDDRPPGRGVGADRRSAGHHGRMRSRAGPPLWTQAASDRNQPAGTDRPRRGADLDETRLAELRARVILEARQAGRKPNEAWAQVAKIIEIDRNLRAFAAAGIRTTYHACDVADRDALEKVLDQVRAADGPIEGIIHGAGIDQACRFEKKTQQNVVATVGAKVTGAYNLMTLTANDPVKHFIGFGSISGRVGSNGQTDYAASSDMLCKLAGWYRGQRADCHAIGFHWHPWDETGMASRPETQAILKASDLRLMPKQTGVRHLLRELHTRPTETEILITDREYHGRYYKNVDETARRDDLPARPGTTIEASEPTSNAIGRVVLRTVNAPLTGSKGAKPLPSTIALLGNNPDADALAASLIARA